MEFREHIRDVADFPSAGVLFRDITPLLGDGRAYGAAMERLAAECAPLTPDVVVSVEARGFLVAAPLACLMGKPLVPVRKPGKLPCATHRVSYELEYGTDTLEIHTDAIGAGQRALIVDDLLATGGTASAAAALARECGGEVAGYAFLIELAALGGRERLGAGLGADKVVTLLQY